MWCSHKALAFALGGLVASVLVSCGTRPSSDEPVGSTASAVTPTPTTSDKFSTDASGDLKIVIRTCDFPSSFTTGARCAYCALDAGWTLIGGGAEIQLQSPSSTDARLRGSFPDPASLDQVGNGVVNVSTPDGRDQNCTGNADVATDIEQPFVAWLARSGGTSSHKLRAYVIGLKVADLQPSVLDVTYNDRGVTNFDGTGAISKLQAVEEPVERGLLIGGGADSVGSNVSNYLTENRYNSATQTWRAVGYDPNRGAGIKTYAIGLNLQVFPSGWTTGVQRSIKTLTTGPVTGTGTASAATSFPNILSGIGVQGVSNDPNSRYLTGLVPFSGAIPGFTVKTKDQGVSVSGTTTGSSFNLTGGRTGLLFANPWSELNYRYGTNPLPGGTPELDRNGNLLLLKDIDSQTTNLVKLDASRNTVWSVPVQPVDFSGNPTQFLNFGTHIAVDSSNNVYVNSFFDIRTVNSDVCVNKFNSNGTLAWRKVYSIGAVNSSEHEQPGPMAFGSDGSLYVVGRSGQNINSAQPTVLLRIDPSTGAERNRRNVANSSDFSVGMGDTVLATDSSGNVYYGGPQGLWSFSQDLQTQRWSRTLMPRALAVDSASSALFVTGVGSAGAQQYNMFVARLSTSNGATVWSWATSNESFSYTYADPTGFNGGDDRLVGGNRILLDSTGQVYAAGHGLVSRFGGGVVAKFDKANGANLWWQPYGVPGSSASLLALGVDNLNRIYTSGTNEPFSMAELRLLSPADGTLLWATQTGWSFAPGSVDYEEVNSVLVDGSGNAYWSEFYSNDDPARNSNVYQFKSNAVPDGTYLLVGLNSGMALDDPNFSPNTGVQMDQWTVNNGSNQKWTVTNLGNNALRLVNQASGLSLGVRSGSSSNGAAVEQNTWTGAASQQWVVTASGKLGYFTLKNLNSGQLLDVVGASTTAGALIDQWPSNGGANQKWRFQ